MNRTALRAAAIAAAALLGPAGTAARADAYDDIVTWDWDQGRAVPAKIEADCRAATSPEARRAVEEKLLKALADRRATVPCRQFVCRMLRRVGSGRSAAALGKLLDEPPLSHMARFALQHMPDPAAGEVLRAALGRLGGALRIGVVSSLAERRDEQAVGAIAALLAEKDVATVRSAVKALGRIGSADAARALAAAKVPAEMKDTLADARLLCADRLLAAGRAAEAAGTYRALFAAGNSPAVRVAALRGITRAEKDRAVPALLALMDDPDGRLRRAAGKYLIEIPGQAATKAIADALATKGPQQKVLLLGVLAGRADRAAAPQVARLLGQKDPAVRRAAIAALAVVGDAACVPALAKATLAGGEEGRAATDALNRLRAPGVGEAMARLLDSPDPAFRAGILNVIAARADRTMIPTMLAAARDSDANVRKAAVKGLTAVAGEKQLPALVELLLAAKDAGERSGLVAAVGAAAARVNDPDRRSAAVLAALDRADTPAKVAMVGLLGRFGGARALASVRKQLRSADPEVATEAVRALAGWSDDSCAADLLEILRGTTNRLHRALAFRGYLRMANLSTGRPAAETAAMYRRAMALATGPEEKKAVLGGLGGARSLEALRLAEGLLADPALRAEAEAACVRIAANLRDAAPDEARATLRKLVASGSEAIRARAQGVLNEMDKYRGYITSWLGSGPYTTGDVWKTAYPPEKPGAAAKWKPLTRGVGPQVINLLEAIGGGDNRAAYVRTYVYSPVDQAVRLEIGSDDGVKVWVGEKLVHANNATRPVQPGQDKASARLAKGWNRILMKITQGGGDWGFALRITRPDGTVPEGLRVSLDGK